MLTEGGLVITDTSHYPLLGTGGGPTLWGNKPLYWVGVFLSQSGKRPSGKGEERKRKPTHASHHSNFPRHLDLRNEYIHT